MASYPAITVYQPWASLLAAGAKPLEFRAHAPPPKHVGKRIAIHAGLRQVRRAELQDLLLTLGTPIARELGLKTELARVILDRALVAPRSLPLGVVVCTAILGEPIYGEALASRLGLAQSENGATVKRNFGWPMSEIRIVEPPAPAKGKQSWWVWTES